MGLHRVGHDSATEQHRDIYHVCDIYPWRVHLQDSENTWRAGPEGHTQPNTVRISPATTMAGKPAADRTTTPRQLPALRQPRRHLSTDTQPPETEGQASDRCCLDGGGRDAGVH